MPRKSCITGPPIVELKNARNDRPCSNAVYKYQVIPRLKPGGRKKL